MMLGAGKEWIKRVRVWSLTLGVGLCLSACNHYHSNFGWGRPASLMTEINWGPPEYRQGYKDGCESGYSGYANSFNKMFYTWKQDPKQVLNPMYYQVWKDAYSFCAYQAMIFDEHALGNYR